MDPLSQKSPSWTPYRYAYNNPLRFIDPNGMNEKERKDKEEELKGKKYGNANTNSNISKNMTTGINSDNSIDCSGYFANVINSESDHNMVLPMGTIEDQKQAFRDAESTGDGILIEEGNLIEQIQNGDIVFTNEGGNHGYVAENVTTKSMDLSRASSSQGKALTSSFTKLADGYITDKVVAIGRPTRFINLPDVSIQLIREVDLNSIQPMQVSF